MAHGYGYFSWEFSKAIQEQERAVRRAARERARIIREAEKEKERERKEKLRTAKRERARELREQKLVAEKRKKAIERQKKAAEKEAVHSQCFTSKLNIILSIDQEVKTNWLAPLEHKFLGADHLEFGALVWEPTWFDPSVLVPLSSTPSFCGQDFGTRKILSAFDHLVYKKNCAFHDTQEKRTVAALAKFATMLRRVTI